LRDPIRAAISAIPHNRMPTGSSNHIYPTAPIRSDPVRFGVAKGESEIVHGRPLLCCNREFPDQHGRHGQWYPMSVCATTGFHYVFPLTKSKSII
jgi:hypothetical protein